MFSQAKTSPTPEVSANEELENDGVEIADAEVLDNVASIGNEFEAKYNQLQDQYTRLAADFENFRKRTRDEQAASLKYGAQNTIQALLPVLDNIDCATLSLTEKSEQQVLFKSFQLIQKQLLDGLGSLGLQKVASIGEPFDPQTHEAVNRMPSNEIPENSVLFESQSGYLLHDKLLRPAQVVVSTGNGEDSPFK